MAQHWPTALHIFNKSDLVDRAAGQHPLAGVFATSATLGWGIDELTHEITKRLVPVVPIPGQAVPFTDRHVELLSGVHQLLTAGDTTSAIRLLDDTLLRQAGAC